MKFAAIADIHLSRYGQDTIEETSNLPERLHSISNSLQEVVSYCNNNNIETLVIAGDTLHGKSIIYALAQDIILNFFDNHPDINFIVIDGNHDLSGKGSDVVSALRPLKSIPNVTWIPFTTTYSYEDILFVPYSDNVDKVIKENKSKILVSHFGLSEGILNSGISIISNIKINDLVDKYELVILGHYHKPQEIIRENISIYYTGSLIQLDWGEKGDNKRFLVVDTKTLDVHSIPLTNYKKHIEIEVTSQNKDEAIKLAKLAKQNGDYIKLIMKEKVDLSTISKEFNVVDKTQRDVTNRGITNSMSEKDKLKRYLEIKEVPKSKIDSYFNIAAEIIDSCEI